MSIQELTQKVKKSAQMRTHDQRIKLLKKAHVLDSEGEFDKKFFSVAKSEDTKTATDKS